MQRNKESQTRWHKASKAMSSPRVEEGMHRANQHHGDVFSQMVTSKQATRGMDATKQVGGPKDQAQSHKGNKAMEKPRSSQTNMDIKHKSKHKHGKKHGDM